MKRVDTRMHDERSMDRLLGLFAVFMAAMIAARIVLNLTQ